MRFIRGEVIGVIDSSTVKVVSHYYKIVNPKIKKYVRRSRRTLVHVNPDFCSCDIGDVVVIMSIPKVSKRKSYLLKENVTAGEYSSGRR